MGLPVLAYWENVRGLTAPIRYLLAYTKEEYEYKTYTVDNWDEWFKEDKVKLEDMVDFPNLPYYINGDIKITQSKVILAHLGRKYNLDGNTEPEKLRLSLAMEYVQELKTAIVNIAYPPADCSNREEVFEKMYKEYEDGMVAKLRLFSKFLGNNKWVAGDRLTYADFFVYDNLDWQRVLFNSRHVESDKNICNYLARFEALDGVKDYLASDSFSRLPIFGPQALFGQSKDYVPK